MREWYKYIIVGAEEEKTQARASTPQEFREHMNGYKTTEGYLTKTDFFKTYYFKEHSRSKIYTDFLANHLKKNQQGLSIASGRCVHELYLMEQGYNIICSDLENYCKDATHKLFPDLEFIEYDVTKGPFQRQVDYVICFSLFFIFEEKILFDVFKNLYDSLKPKGQLFIDPGGAEDTNLTYVLDEVISRGEMVIKGIRERVKTRRRFKVVRSHHGYRSKDKEMISIAEQAGLKWKGTVRFDHTIELKGRSALFRRLPDGLTQFLGRHVPHVRISHFVKE